MGPTWVKFVRMAPSGCWVLTERVAWSWWYTGTSDRGLVGPTAQIWLGVGLFEVIPPYIVAMYIYSGYICAIHVSISISISISISYNRESPYMHIYIYTYTYTYIYIWRVRWYYLKKSDNQPDLRRGSDQTPIWCAYTMVCTTTTRPLFQSVLSNHWEPCVQTSPSWDSWVIYWSSITKIW